MHSIYDWNVRWFGDLRWLWTQLNRYRWYHHAPDQPHTCTCTYLAPHELSFGTTQDYSWLEIKIIKFCHKNRKTFIILRGEVLWLTDSDVWLSCLSNGFYQVFARIWGLLSQVGQHYGHHQPTRPAESTGHQPGNSVIPRSGQGPVPAIASYWEVTG